ncbi:MAG TPA: SAM-dependent methyltransferase [Haliangium sp.]|nr:SAM-dependent methyltransferase [Haliangium sp.]
MSETRFYFSTCQFGAERAVKAEVLRRHPSLRFAFSRPGFITFKESDAGRPPIAHVDGIFVRLWGSSIAHGRGEAAREILDAVPAGALIHAFERDTFVPGDDPLGFVWNERIRRFVAVLPADVRARHRWDEEPRPGEALYDLIWLDEGQVFLGRHVHGAHLAPAPGNTPRIPLAASAPSRAYLKIEEAILRYGPPIRPGARALEVGCAPGGATTAMLARGFAVRGIDPRRMDERLYREAHFTSVQKLARQVTVDDLRGFNPDWIVMDMSIAPLEALDELAHVIEILKASHGSSLAIEKGLLTLKLNDWAFAEMIPLYLKRIGEMGFADLKPTQLCSNRQEFFVLADAYRPR